MWARVDGCPPCREREQLSEPGLAGQLVDEVGLASSLKVNSVSVEQYLQRRNAKFAPYIIICMQKIPGNFSLSFFRTAPSSFSFKN